jgi:predicted PurR-regulated permease PerM
VNGAGGSPEDDRPPQRVEILIPIRTMVVVLAFAFLVALAVLSLGTLLSIFVAAVLALGLDPPVGALVRRGWNRGRASVAMFAALFAAVVAIALFTAGPLWDQITDFVNNLPKYWDELQQQSWFQTLTQTAGADDKIRNGLKELASGLPDAANAVLGIAGGVFSSVLSLVTLTFLALFLLMERPTITDWLFGFASPAVERRWRPVLEDSISAVSSSLIGNVAISVVAATVAGLSAWAMGLPFPIVLAVITGFLDLIPQVGATVAAVILVAVGLTVSTPAALVMLVVQLIYQQVENYIVYPLVYRRAVELSPFTTIVAVLIAGSLLGVVGAILAVPFAAVIKIVLHEAGDPRRTRMSALRGGADGSVALDAEHVAAPQLPLKAPPGEAEERVGGDEQQRGQGNRERDRPLYRLARVDRFLHEASPVNAEHHRAGEHDPDRGGQPPEDL